MLCVLSVLVLSSFRVALSQGFLKARGDSIVNGAGQNVLLKGIGLGGWMLQEGYMLGIYQEAQQHAIRSRIEQLIGPGRTQVFYNAWHHNFITKADVDSLKSWGFNSIRLPLHYNLFTLPVDEEPVRGKNTWLVTGFEMTDSLLSWCRTDGMYLILDLHAAPGGQGNDLNISDRDASQPSLWQSAADQQKTVALWKKLAERYGNEPWIGGYDILNEPNWGFTDSVHDRNGVHEKDNAAIRDLFRKITAAIRSVDSRHLIIIEGNGWGNNYNGILPPWDSNMVLSFHKYWNRNQPQDIEHILSAREQYHVPVWLGETGENSNVWYTEEVRLLEHYNIGWSMWPLKKMGANNPLEIPTNPYYEQVRKFMNASGPRPAGGLADSAFTILARDTRNRFNIVHRDVIDALFRQVSSDEAVPFRDEILGDSLHVAATDYDLGRSGSAYYDLDSANYSLPGDRNVGNRGRVYRNDGVDIYPDSSHEGDYYVGHIESGEWLQYTIRVSTDGVYTCRFVAAPVPASSGFALQVDGVQEATILLPAAPAGSAWNTYAVKNIRLAAGNHRVRIEAITGGYKLKFLEFIRQQAPLP